MQRQLFPLIKKLLPAYENELLLEPKSSRDDFLLSLIVFAKVTTLFLDQREKLVYKITKAWFRRRTFHLPNPTE